ncbi:SDR family oxidoreductase [Palleronia sp.]|uniref:SDR family oxidoreductase n=1 Tax=Palleronia sp. TaxID=1940284 RepID=UPI0035C78BCC
MSQKTAIVLGGSAGVGHAVVEALIDRGYRVGVIARGQDRLDAMETHLGDHVATAAADVGDARALERAVDSLVSTLGRPDVWINSAMLTSYSRFEDVPPDEFNKIVETTLLGQVNGTRLALRYMKRGNIVHIGSALAYQSLPFQAAYCTSKHGINGFVSALRAELLRERRPISLSIVQLPAVNTPQFDWALNRLGKKPQPAPPILDPSAAAQAVLQAVDTDAREILVGKSVFALIFGSFVAPGWLDRKLAKDGAEAQKSAEAEPGGRENNMFAPVTYPASSRGRFDDRTRHDAVAIDGDKARYIAFGGLAVTSFAAGLLLRKLFD